MFKAQAYQPVFQAGLVRQAFPQVRPDPEQCIGGAVQVATDQVTLLCTS